MIIMHSKEDDMAFIKDGETKVYKDKVIKTGSDKQPSKIERVRYGVDDLVKDSKDSEEEANSGEKDVLD
jgi:hypothetical protein